MYDFKVTLKEERGISQFDANQVEYSLFLAINFDSSDSDKNIVDILSKKISLNNYVLTGNRNLYEYFCNICNNFSNYFFVDEEQLNSHDIPKNIIICDVHKVEFFRFKRKFSSKFNIFSLSDILIDEQTINELPRKYWIPIESNIYPVDIPEIDINNGNDLILVDCPSRNLSMMPNGLGYIHNAIKKTGIKFQTLDLDIYAYHEYHIHRIYDHGGEISLSDGSKIPVDPWLAEHYDFWTIDKSAVEDINLAVNQIFDPFISKMADKIISANPKVLGLSIQQCNEFLSTSLVRKIRKKLKDLIVIVGGYSCYNPDIGLAAFPDADYMFIGEAELTIGPTIKKILNGEKLKNEPGVISKYDKSIEDYIPAPMPHNLDIIDFPKYEWFDNLDVYKNYNNYQLTPIIASRGCRWSRCTFCAERFYWRIRSAKNFVDELEWFAERGCYLFMFNESDLNGMPEKVMEICDEIIRRGLHERIRLTGQLRIHKKSTREFFQKLRAANFVALRFGVDAFSENTLKLQKKGYTVEMIYQNLKDCWESGIFTEVNWVIGIPGETEEDIDEGVKLILDNRKYIGRLANINPLILVNGGVYWLDPEAHDIKFREDKDELYKKYPRSLPANSWYSENPYIDAAVRQRRFEKVVTSLHKANFHIGDWALKVIDDVEKRKDRNRSSGDNVPSNYTLNQ